VVPRATLPGGHRAAFLPENRMRARSKFACLAVALLGGMPLGAAALTCFEIVDRDDATVYRAPVPPFPLAGADYESGRRRLAGQGQTLRWFEATACIEFVAAKPIPRPAPADAAGDAAPDAPAAAPAPAPAAKK
jgi:hypothetical protein